MVWGCTACTYINNNDAVSCMICGTKQASQTNGTTPSIPPPQPSSLPPATAGITAAASGAVPPVATNVWQCAMCSTRNVPSATSCATCSARRPVQPAVVMTPLPPPNAPHSIPNSNGQYHWPQPSQPQPQPQAQPQPRSPSSVFPSSHIVNPPQPIAPAHARQPSATPPITVPLSGRPTNGVIPPWIPPVPRVVPVSMAIPPCPIAAPAVVSTDASRRSMITPSPSPSPPPSVAVQQNGHNMSDEPEGEPQMMREDSSVDLGQWTCPTCTLSNAPMAASCAACGTSGGRSLSRNTSMARLTDPRTTPVVPPSPQSPQPHLQQPSPSPIPAGGWACSTCTFINTAATSQKCDLCQTPRHRHPSTVPPQEAAAERDRLARAAAESRQRMEEREKEEARLKEMERLRLQEEAKKAAQAAQAAALAAEQARLAAERARAEEAEIERKRKEAAMARARAAATLPWSCTFCTFINPVEATACSVCARKRVVPTQPDDAPMVGPTPAVVLPRQPVAAAIVQPVSIPTPAIIPAAVPTQWKCTSCTLLNAMTLRECSACRAPPPPGTAIINSGIEGKRASDAVPSLPLNGAMVDAEAKAAWLSTDREVTVRTTQAARSKSQFDNIMTICRAAGEQFVDTDFRPGDPALFGSGPPESESYPWRRGRDIRKEADKSEWTMWRGGITPEDIQQGTLGDCWFLSALSVLAERPSLVENIIITKEYNDIGAYQVQFCKDGQWQNVIVDDWFPVDQYGRLAYSRCRGNQLWVSIIEKAYAKMHGSYQAIVSGMVYEALADLTGAPCDMIDLNAADLDADLVWAQLLSFRQQGFLMGASCGGSPADEKMYASVGLQKNHAYSVLDVKQEGHLQLVKLRNPWGRGEWKGDYGDDSPKWTPELRRRLDVKSRADGVFWMCYPDFLKYFRGVDVCKHQDDWHALRVSDTFGSNGVRAALEFSGEYMYEVSIPASTWSIVSLIQPDMRGSAAKRPYVYNDIGCFVSSAYADAVFDFTRHQPAATLFPEGKRIVSTEVMMTDATKRYLILPVSFLGGRRTALPSPPIVDGKFAPPLVTPVNKPHPFVLSIYSSHAVKVKKLPCHPPSLAIGMQLSAARGQVQHLGKDASFYTLSAGGGICFVVINRHPDLWFHVQLDCTDSSGLQSSRAGGVFYIQDSIPPMHRQVVLVLTTLNRYSGYRYKRTVSYVHRRSRGDGHKPPLQQYDLHTPFPL